MINSEPLVPPRVSTVPATQAVGYVGYDAGFNARWAAWVARGVAHEKRARRKLAIWAGVLTVAASIVYGLFQL